ncbi:hypothetical protein H311_03562, partial [Anncaliia algerae PRA109]
MDFFYIVVLFITFYTEKICCSMFNVSDDKDILCEPKPTENTPCIRKMDKYLEDIHNELKLLKSSECKTQSEKESNLKIIKFLYNLQHKNFFNGKNFPMKYNGELEDIRTHLSIPTISSRLIKMVGFISNNLKLSKSGASFHSCFLSLLDKYNELHNIQLFNLLEHVKFLHERLM